MSSITASLKLFLKVFRRSSALYAFVILFDLYAPVYLDDYYLDILYTKYAKEWYYGNIIVSSISLFFALAWVYTLGKGTNHEKREPLLINKEEENE